MTCAPFTRPTSLAPIVFSLMLAACGGGGSSDGGTNSSTAINANSTTSSSSYSSSSSVPAMPIVIRSNAASVVPGGVAAQSTQYKMISTVGPSVDSTASTSTHYCLQGGLTSADISLR